MAIVADGMGSIALAAEQVIRTARQAFDLFSPQTDHVPTLLRGIAHDAHTLMRLAAMSAAKPLHSTMAVLVITPDRGAFWAHVGNSRMYRFDGPNFAERTKNDALTEGTGANGVLPSGQIDPSSGTLGNGEREPPVTLGSYANPKPGDAFLLCTDGFWPYFKAAELGAIIATHPARQASEILIAKARDRAGKSKADNCTLAVVRLCPLPQEPKSYSASKIRRAV